MKKWMAAWAAAMLLAVPAAQAAGGVHGNVVIPARAGLTAMGGGEQGGVSGFGIAIDGKSAKTSLVAKVQLISMDLRADSLTTNEIEDWYMHDKAPKDKPVFVTKTGEDGTYMFPKVPAGRYYLVVVSPHTTLGTAMGAKTELGERLAKQLPQWDRYSISVLGMNEWLITEVVVTDDVMQRVDRDFSPNPFGKK